MFEQFVPKLKIGALKPLPVIDNSAYEFYRLAPPGVMLVMVAVGLAKFSKEDVERVFAPIDALVDQLMEREVDLIMQSGVPLPLLLGMGVDFSIHMQLALRRHEGDRLAVRGSLGRALLLAGATTVAGFGSLAFSTNTGMASLGKVCALGITLAMVVAVYLLPVWWKSFSRPVDARR